MLISVGSQSAPTRKKIANAAENPMPETIEDARDNDAERHLARGAFVVFDRRGIGFVLH